MRFLLPSGVPRIPEGGRGAPVEPFVTVTVRSIIAPSDGVPGARDPSRHGAADECSGAGRRRGGLRDAVVARSGQCRGDDGDWPAHRSARASGRSCGPGQTDPAGCGDRTALPLGPGPPREQPALARAASAAPRSAGGPAPRPALCAAASPTAETGSETVAARGGRAPVWRPGPRGVVAHISQQLAHVRPVLLLDVRVVVLLVRPAARELNLVDLAVVPQMLIDELTAVIRVDATQA